MPMFGEGDEEWAAQDSYLWCFERDLQSVRIRPLLSEMDIFG